MGHTSARDLQNRLFDALEGLHHGSIVQIAMDGPNVNWRLYTDMSVVKIVNPQTVQIVAANH